MTDLYTTYPTKKDYIDSYIQMDSLLTTPPRKIMLQSLLRDNMNRVMEPLWVQLYGEEGYPTLRRKLGNAYTNITKGELLNIVSTFRAILKGYITSP